MTSRKKRIKQIREILNQKKPGEINNFIEFFFVWGSKKAHEVLDDFFFDNRNKTHAEMRKIFDFEKMDEPIPIEYKKLKKMWENGETDDKYFSDEEIEQAKPKQKTLKNFKKLR